MNQPTNKHIRTIFSFFFIVFIAFILLVALLGVNDRAAADTTMTINNTVTSDPSVVCYVQNGTTSTTYSSSDSTAVQEGIDAAAEGDTLKLAGTCTGTQSREGETQTAYISKTLTLVGGYTTTNWTTAGGYTTTLSADENGRVVYIEANTTVTLTSLVLKDGKESVDGAGIYIGNSATATLSNNTITDNTTSGDGGGIFADSYSTLSIDNSIISQNLSTGDENTGGGIFAQGDALNITDSLIYGNSALIGGGIGMISATDLNLSGTTVYSNSASYAGGGIYLHDGLHTLYNNTISQNDAPSGAGIEISSTTLTLTHNTIVSNTGSYGMERSSSSTVYAENSVIAYHASGDCSRSLTDNGYNIDSDDSCGLSNGNGSLPNTEPFIEPLAADGGATAGATNEATINTHAIAPFSEAVDLVPYGVNGCGTTYTTDQRGVTRPNEALGNCTSGAYEPDGSRSYCAVYNDGTTYQSSDATALQNAIDGATAGDTLKIAGICAGVQVRSAISQTAYLSESLTLEGGYVDGSWSSLSYTDTIATTLDAEGNGRVVYIQDSLEVTLTNLIIQNGAMADHGAGVFVGEDSYLTIDHSLIQENQTTTSSADGAGVMVNGGSATIQNSSILSNTSGDSGGGIYVVLGSAVISDSTLSYNQADNGGGLYAIDEAAVTISSTVLSHNESDGVAGALANYGSVINLYNSTVHDNEATNVGGAAYVDNYTSLHSGVFTATGTTFSHNSGTSGGAIYLADESTSSLVNSTFSNNEATTGYGGALMNSDADAYVSLLHVTVYSNTAALGGGGLYLDDEGTLTMRGSFMGQNSSRNCAKESGSETYTDLGYNISTDGTCSLTDGTSKSNRSSLTLTTLADNEGVTAGADGEEIVKTHSFSPNRAAIVDQIDWSGGSCGGSGVTTDQRGVARPQYEKCDIGAVENDDVREPTAGDDSYTYVQNYALTISAADGVLANDSDEQGDNLTITLNDVPTGSVALASDGSFVYTPTVDSTATDQFTYILSDGTYTSTGTVTLTGETGSCFVQNSTTVTTYGSADASAVQTAIDGATAGDLLKIAGRCTGIQTVAGNGQTAYISKTLTLEGGYDEGMGWDKSSYYGTFTTTLDADQLGRVVYIAPGITVTLDSLSIVNGYDTDEDGMGVYADRPDLLIIHNSVISNNIMAYESWERGGGIYVQDASWFTLTNSTVISNSADFSAGGLAIVNVASFSILSNTLSSNLSGGDDTGEGGGIYIDDSNGQIENNLISDNYSDDYGGGIYIEGNSAVTLTANTITNNRADDDDGGGSL